MPLAELRRKALGSDDEEEPAGTVQRTPAPAVASPAAPSPISPLASLASGMATEATIRRSPAVSAGQPAAPLPHRASPAPSPSPAVQHLPPGPGLIPGLAGSAPQLVQRSAAPASSSLQSLPSLSSFPAPGAASPPPLSNAAGIAMPLARVAAPAAGAAQAGSSPVRGTAFGASPSPGLIQRQATASTGDTGPAPAPAAPAASAAAGTAEATGASDTNDDELVERVLRRLMRTLAVEGERRGLRRWP